MGSKKVLRDQKTFLVAIDIFIIIALVINFNLIIFDLLFGIELVNSFFLNYLPDFHSFYSVNIHANFELIDLGFIALYLGEFVLSWALSSYFRVYDKWFFYPIYHWYDLIGCIPIGSFRFVRFIRVISILLRLHKLGIVNLVKTQAYKVFLKYYNILVEEVTDRVVARVLTGVQEEIAEGGPVVEEIIHGVIKPKEELIVEWISRRVEFAISNTLISKKDDIEQYVDGVVSRGLHENSTVKTLELVPLIGKPAAKAIDETIGNVVYNVIQNTINDLASNKNRYAVRELTNSLISTAEFEDKDDELTKILVDISNETIEIIKKKVMVQKWKVKEEEEKLAKLQAKEERLRAKAEKGSESRSIG
ncbi:MAG: hypothetical protein AAF363_01405 [Bacteroidota bacterium]